MLRSLRCALLVLVSASTLAQNGPGKVPINSHEVHPDGSITFRYRSASAKEVTVGVDFFAKPFMMTWVTTVSGPRQHPHCSRRSTATALRSTASRRWTR